MPLDPSRVPRARQSEQVTHQADAAVSACRAHPDLQADLVAAIQSLPPKYREAIVLRDIHEWSISEIAAQLRLTREAVKRRIHRGRMMIREYLND